MHRDDRQDTGTFRCPVVGRSAGTPLSVDPAVSLMRRPPPRRGGGSARNKRIAYGVLMNSYGQVVTIFTQLLSIPIFLTYWDVSAYGVWLVLTAVPSYLALSDVGIVTAAGTSMTMLVAQENEQRAQVVLRTATVFICVAGGSVLAVVATVLILVGDSILGGEERAALLMLVAGVVAGQVGGLAEAVYRSTGRYPLGTFGGSTVRLGEWGGWMVAVVFEGGYGAVAACGLVCRLVGTGLLLRRSVRSSQFSWGFSDASGAELRALLKPSGGVVLLAAGNALTIQGLSLVIAHALGPVALVVFNTYRTAARVSVQAASVLSHAVWPELSRLAGAGRGPELRLLVRRSAVVSMGLSIVIALIGYLAASQLLEAWTVGEVEFDSSLAIAFYCYSMIAGSWYFLRVLLLATNNHLRLGVVTFVAGGLLLPIAYLIASGADVAAVAWLMGASELALAVAASASAGKVLRLARGSSEASTGKIRPTA